MNIPIGTPAAETWNEVPQEKQMAARFWFEIFQMDSREAQPFGEEAVDLMRDLLRRRLEGLLETGEG